MSEKTCALCQAEDGKYVCPKCNILYCSVNCFRKEQHLECSEAFYKKWVEEEIRLNNKPLSQEMISILKRNDFMHEDFQDDDIENDEDDFEDIAERMKNVDLNNVEEIWENLTVDERKEFRTLVSSGEIRKMLPKWTPWWEFHKPKLINDFNAKSEDTCEGHTCPTINISIPLFRDLTKKAPSEKIPCMLANVLMSYAYMARWFKGKHNDMPVEGVSTLLALSAVLRENKLCNNLIEAYVTFEDDLKNCTWCQQDGIENNLIWNDVIAILKGIKGNVIYFSLKSCFCDIHTMLKKASKILNQEQKIHTARFTKLEPNLLQIRLLSKKIIYYLSWIDSHGGQLENLLLK